MGFFVATSECHTWELDAVFSFKPLATGLPVLVRSEFELCAFECPKAVHPNPVLLETDRQSSTLNSTLVLASQPPDPLLHIFLPEASSPSFLAQLVKLKCWTQQRELKWLILNKWTRLFHSSRVKLPLVNMSASWCWVSAYLIWILGSRLILSNSQSRATLWVLDTCLIVGLLPVTIILIAASLSSETNTAPHREGLTLDETWSTFLQIQIDVLGWILVFHVEFGVTRQVSLWLLTFEFVDFVLVKSAILQ